MILAALNDYYQRLLEDADSGVSRPGYSQEKISFAIVLDASGSVVDVLDLRGKDGKKLRPAFVSVPQPEKRTVGIKSNFLWDKTSYVLGVSATSKRSDREHAAFVALHLDALAGNDDPGLKAVLAFVQAWTPEQFQTNPHFVRHAEDIIDANVVFRFDGEQAYIHERPAARTLWRDQQAVSDDDTQGMCLVTGEQAPLARLHPAIKGVNGAQTAGASIVSFNLDAFTSYGKSQGDNAPVSIEVAFTYTTALNHLLRRDPANRQRLQLGDTTVVFWAQAPDVAAAEEGENLLAAFFDPRDDDARATEQLAGALQLIRQGRPLRDLGGHIDDGTQVFVLGLAPNASRLSIRFWETGSLARFAQRLADHFGDLELYPEPWRKPPSLRWLAMQTAPIHGERAMPKAEDVSPQLAGEFARAVLSGSRYPQSLLRTLIMRFRADGHVSGIRVALCKATLARAARLDRQQGKSITQGELPVSLDTQNTDAGYLLGRLFSSLENIQRAALGGKVNATIRDRYYGAASATPASIFPVLLRNAQNHLGKVRKDKPGLAVNLEKDIGQIIDAMPPTFPRSLPIEEQGRFAIGYYHQTQARFARHDTDTIDSEGAAA